MKDMLHVHWMRERKLKRERENTWRFRRVGRGEEGGAVEKEIAKRSNDERGEGREREKK